MYHIGYCRSILVAGGAAAIGFMAHKLMTDYEKELMSTAQASTSWGPNDNITGQRKANRTRVPDDNLPVEVRCIVCLVNPREIILLPCKHVCLCEDCAGKIERKCPVCNINIQDKRAVYLP